MSEAPHVQLIVNGITIVDGPVESMDMQTNINGDISLVAKRAAIVPDWAPR